MAADNLAMAGFLAVLMAIPAAAPPRADELALSRRGDSSASEEAGSAAANEGAKGRVMAGARAGAAAGGGEGRATVATMATAFAVALVVLEAGKGIATAVGLAGGALGVASLLAPFVSAAAAAGAAAFKNTPTFRSKAPASPSAAGLVSGPADATVAAMVGYVEGYTTGKQSSASEPAAGAGGEQVSGEGSGSSARRVGTGEGDTDAETDSGDMDGSEITTKRGRSAVQLAATSRWNAERLVVYNVTLSELRAGGTETGRHKGSMRDGDRERSEAPGKGDVSTVGPFQGGEALGGALMLVFFAALGACADPRAALTSGGPTLAFIAVQLSVQLACCLLVGRHLLKLPTWAVLTAGGGGRGCASVL